MDSKALATYRKLIDQWLAALSSKNQEVIGEREVELLETISRAEKVLLPVLIPTFNAFWEALCFDLADVEEDLDLAIKDFMQRDSDVEDFIFTIVDACRSEMESNGLPYEDIPPLLRLSEEEQDMLLADAAAEGPLSEGSYVMLKNEPWLSTVPGGLGIPADTLGQVLEARGAAILVLWNTDPRQEHCMDRVILKKVTLH